MIMNVGQTVKDAVKGAVHDKVNRYKYGTGWEYYWNWWKANVMWWTVFNTIWIDLAIALVLFAAFMGWRYYKKNQAQVAGQSGSGETWRQRNVKGGTESTTTRHTEETKTVYQAIRRGLEVSNDGQCLGWRPNDGTSFQWLSYSEVIKRSKNIGVGMMKLGLKNSESNRTFIGIHADNRPEGRPHFVLYNFLYCSHPRNDLQWLLVEHASYCYNMIVVPIYDTLGDEAVEHIVEQTRLECLVIDKLEKVDRYALIKEKGSAKNLRVIIVMNDINSAEDSKRLLSLAKTAGIEVHSLQDVEKTGASTKDAPVEVPPRPEDISTIYYTSGTTGVPKGVIITHGNLLSCVHAVIERLGDKLRPTPDDSILSFLPLAHTLERCVEVCLLHQGASIGYYSGNIRKLADDYRYLRPTMAAAVPRVLNRVYEQTVATARKTVVFLPVLRAGIWFKTALVMLGIMTRNTPFDWLFFRKIQKGFGGRLRLVVVGSAPLDAPVMRFMRAALGCNVLEGYGQTETSGVISLAKPGDWHTEHVGELLSCNEIKLVDVPDSGVFVSKTGQGEVLVRGSNVFQGYYKMEDKTKETIVSGGWARTGDIGGWTSFGTLKIVDRCKNIFKLAQGEYIATDKIEEIYVRDKLVKQIFLYGDSKKSQLIALILPDEKRLKQLAETDGSFADLCKDDQVRQAVVKQLGAHAGKSGLKSFEQVKNVALITEEFSEKNGLMTPTQKVKRKAVQEKYQDVLDGLYAELEGGGKKKSTKTKSDKKPSGESGGKSEEAKDD